MLHRFNALRHPRQQTHSYQREKCDIIQTRLPIKNRFDLSSIQTRAYWNVLHELSIAVHIVETLTDDLAHEPGRVAVVRLKVGVFAGVVEDALQFAWDVACQDSRFEGSSLEIVEVKAVAHCPRCEADREILSSNYLRCPICGASTPQIVAGEELQILSVELASGKGAS